MKKLFFAVVFTAIAMTSMNAQGVFSVGANVGLPMGDFKNASGLSIGLDVNYLFEMGDALEVGFASGYNHSIGKSNTVSVLGFSTSIDYPDFKFVPLAGAGRFMASDEFTLGLDLGYALGLDDAKGGVYYRPMVGYNVSDNIAVNAYYTGVSLDGGSFSSVNLGVMFRL